MATSTRKQLISQSTSERASGKTVTPISNEQGVRGPSEKEKRIERQRADQEWEELLDSR